MGTGRERGEGNSVLYIEIGYYVCMWLAFFFFSQLDIFLLGKALFFTVEVRNNLRGKESAAVAAA